MEWSLFTPQISTNSKVEVEAGWGTYPSGIVTTAFAEVCMKLEFVAEEFSRDVDVFTTDNDDMLSIEDLFRDCGGKTTWHKIST